MAIFILSTITFSTTSYAMRSWRHGGIRFFSTLFTGYDSFWNLWVTAACGKAAAVKFRAEIRLSSNLAAGCNIVFYCPGKKLTGLI